MNYYGVLTSSLHYHGHEPLTYEYDKELKVGQIVSVPLRHRQVIGVILTQAAKPNFDVKDIAQVINLPILPIQTLNLAEWLSTYYPAPLGIIAAQFLPAGLDTKAESFQPEAVKVSQTPKLPNLTKDQQNAIKTIESADASTFLLHGDTGTGKTRVYIEIAKKQLAKNSSALILTPEIGLTPQLVRDIRAGLSHQVVLIHSNLTPKQRRQAWLTILRSAQPLVVIGPRSALFTPIRHLGVIVMDEAHDGAYKQEQAPYYQTIRVAAKLASLHGCIFIIGSATPNVTDYYVAQAKHMPILRLQELAVKVDQSNKQVELIDSKDKSLFSRNQHLSDSLLNAIETVLKRGEQSLIFLNRRGTARQVLCQQCGWQALCPNCDLPLTFHGDSFSMRCHTCGYKTDALHTCPVCGSADIVYKSIGTKALVDTLTKLFPKARIQRFDSDSKKSERFEGHYHNVVAGNVDILVGTQILVKGLDLPKLSLVGVVAADTSLTFPDYTAEERTFQLLNQILGRVGRGHLAGKAIIQTYHPDSLAIRAAIDQAWEDFYKSQLSERQKYLFPPFCYLLKLTVTRRNPDSTKRAALEFKQKLTDLKLKLQIIGPGPSFREKSAKGYDWQLVIKSKDRNLLLTVIGLLPSGWSYDIDPNNLL